MSTPAKGQRLLVCNCQRTMQIDARRLAEALRLEAPAIVHSELCRSQMTAFEDALAANAALQVACTQ
jgi:hypothetical protein